MKNLIILLLLLSPNLGKGQICIDRLPLNYENNLPNYTNKTVGDLLRYLSLGDDIDYYYVCGRMGVLMGVDILISDSCRLSILLVGPNHANDIKHNLDWDFNVVKLEKMVSFGFYNRNTDERYFGYSDYLSDLEAEETGF